MFDPLPAATLKTGERVEAGIVRPPAGEWADRVEALLRHKGDPWNWQNSEVLRTPQRGLDARFFILLRGEKPFANILVAEAGGVGLVGHVWTEPRDRGTGASSLLMERLIADFRRRGGRALFLGTEPQSAPWHYYRRRGFAPIEEGSGSMVRYFQPAEEFSSEWFASGELDVVPLSWRHWPGSIPLFLGDFEGVVRVAAAGLFGRSLPEAPLLPLLRSGAGEHGTARVLESRSGAVAGFASVQTDPLWPDRAIVDVYCHPRAWSRAGDLLGSLAQPSGKKRVSYADAAATSKRDVLLAAGFKPVAELPRWIESASPSGNAVDVIVFEKTLAAEARS